MLTLLVRQRCCFGYPEGPLKEVGCYRDGAFLRLQTLSGPVFAQAGELVGSAMTKHFNLHLEAGRKPGPTRSEKMTQVMGM